MRPSSLVSTCIICALIVVATFLTWRLSVQSRMLTEAQAEREAGYEAGRSDAIMELLWKEQELIERERRSQH